MCPIITKRTIAKNINLDRMVAVATEASEQCERLTIPTILSPQKFDDLLKNWDNTRNLYYLSERDNTAIMPVFSERVAFLVGPEGGFAPEEIKKLNNFPVAYPINLGKRILRAETACIASMVIWNQCVGW